MYLKEMSDRKTFDQYVAGNAFCHYMKTSMWGEMQKKTNGMSYRMMGLFDGNSLKGTALILEKHGLFPYLYVPKGMCLDSLDLVEEAYTLLKEYAIYRKAVFLRIDPNILRMEKDLKGNVIIGGEDHSDVTETLKTIGYVHKGYGYAYDGSWTNRFTLIVDLDDMAGVFRKFSSHRRTLIRKAEKMLMLTRRGNEQDLDYLMKLQKQLSAIKGFRPDDRAYYLNLLECFGQYADIYVTEINVDASIAHLSSYKTKKEEEKKSIADCIEVLKGYRDTYGNEIVTAAGFMFHFGNTGWCWQYYYDHAFARFGPLDGLNYFAMKDMHDKGVRHYDFCGFGGITTGYKDDPEFQLYEYKHSFAPRFVEHIGQFDYIVDEGKMKLYVLQDKLVRKIRRRYHLRKYRKL